MSAISLGLLISPISAAAVPGFERLAMGEWSADGGKIRQNDDQGPAFLLTGGKDKSRYTVSVQVKPAFTKTGGEAGLVIHLTDADNYLAFSIVKRRSGPFAVLRMVRKKPPMNFVADQAPVVESADGAYELKAEVNGRDVACYLNGKPSVSFMFEGTPPPYNSHGKAWDPDPESGWTGLMAIDSRAEYSGFQIGALANPSAMRLREKGRFDEHGQLLPQQSYSETMRRLTDWFLHSDEVVDKSKAPESIRSWAPYLLTNFLGTDDTLWGLGGEMAFNHALVIEGAVYYAQYSGDLKYLALAKTTADWEIEHRTPKDWAMPYLAPSFLAIQKDGTGKGQEWGYEPDKTAYMGYTLLKLYQVSGEKKYLNAALEMAGTLAKFQGPNGDWPFRVNARTGEVKHGYTCSQLWYVWFFEALADVTGDEKYRARRDKAFAWMLENPVKTNVWMGLYGDIASGQRSFDQWVALETAMYLIDRRDQDPTFLEKARKIVEWVEKTLVVDYGFFRGVPGIVEQSSYRIVLTHHQLRYAEIYAKLADATGNREYSRKAIEAANSVTWNLMSDGKMRQGFWDHSKAAPLGLSFNNQFGRIMAAVPETAPKKESHLLRTTAIAGAVTYSAQKIAYRTTGPSLDQLITATPPVKVMAGGKTLTQAKDPRVKPDSWSWEPTTGRVQLRHQAPDIEIALN